MRDKKDKNEVLVHENGRDPVSEAFRIVRTNMDFMRVKDKNLQVVMFTSVQSGSRQDICLHEPGDESGPDAQEGRFGRPRYPQGNTRSHVKVSDKGITNYLSGRIDNVDEIIQQNELCDKLDVIHAGPVPLTRQSSC